MRTVGGVLLLLTALPVLSDRLEAGGLNCSGISRFGKSIRHVQPPIVCQATPDSPGEPWCDQPGRHYPWRKIRDYLHRSSADAKRRAGHIDTGDIQRMLKKYGFQKLPAGVRRRRSADGNGDVSGQGTADQSDRHGPRVGFWQASGDRRQETDAVRANAAPPVDYAPDFEFFTAPEDDSRSGNDESEYDREEYDEGFTEGEELALLFSHFTEPSGILVTKGVLEEIIKLEEAFQQAMAMQNPTEPPVDEATSTPGTWLHDEYVIPGMQDHQAGQQGDDELRVPDGKPNEEKAQNSPNSTWQHATNTYPTLPDEGGTTATMSDHGVSQAGTVQKYPDRIQEETAAPAGATYQASSDPWSAPTSHAPPTPVGPDHRYPDAHQRRPASGSQILAEIRTGEDILDEIRTGEDVLADIIGEEKTPSGNSGGGVFSGTATPARWSPDEASSAFGQDEYALAEVQYYLPPRSTAAPPTTHGDWPPPSQWRPLAPPPRAEALVAHPPLRPSEQHRQTVTAPARPATAPAQPVTTASTPPTATTTTADQMVGLDDVMETVYTDAISRPGEKAKVTRPATAAPVGTTTTARPTIYSTTTPDPYTMSACRASVEIRSPFYAMNTQNIWKMLINMPPFETYIHMEHCVRQHEQGRCADGCRCTQRYTVRTMPVYERDANDCDLVYMDKFLFPSHCDCACLPAPLRLFNITRRPATTPTPIVSQVNLTLTPPRLDDAVGNMTTPAPPSERSPTSGSSTPSIGVASDISSLEALKAGLAGARVVTAAPTSSPASRRSPGFRPPTAPPRRPIAPAQSLVRSHRNRNRGPPFPPLRRYAPNSVSRRGGRSEQMPPALPR